MSAVPPSATNGKECNWQAWQSYKVAKLQSSIVGWKSSTVYKVGKLNNFAYALTLLAMRINKPKSPDFTNYPTRLGTSKVINKVGRQILPMRKQRQRLCDLGTSKVNGYRVNKVRSPEFLTSCKVSLVYRS